MIDVSNVTKAYGDAIVVDGVDLAIPAGGFTSIIGPNGAGKSTLLSMIGRLTPMTSGSVRVDGLDVARTPTAELARRLAVLRQENVMAARLTVRDLVGFGRYPHSRGRLTAEDRRHVDEAIGFLDLEPLADRFIDEMSGGQRQRAHVAMILAQGTDYVLLDEPLNNLDMKHAASMMKLFRRAADDLGRTIVAVLHDVNFAAHYSDRIVAMREGRVLHVGPPEEIVTPQVMRDVYDHEISVHEIDGRRVAMFYR